MRRLSRLLLLPFVALTVIPFIAAPASAHGHIEVGEYSLTIGWWTEPAFANLPNGPEVTILHQETEEPIVKDVDLQVDLTFGDETVTYPLEPAFVVGVFGDPGNYNADLVPTRPGTYEFRIYGTIEGEEVDETMVSGPDTFSDINDPAELAFPIADPSNAELGDRLEQETARLTDALAAAEESAATAADDASSAKTLAYIAIAVGALALIAGIAMGARGRGKAGKA